MCGSFFAAIPQQQIATQLVSNDQLQSNSRPKHSLDESDSIRIKKELRKHGVPSLPANMIPVNRFPAALLLDANHLCSWLHEWVADLKLLVRHLQVQLFINLFTLHRSRVWIGDDLRLRSRGLHVRSANRTWISERTVTVSASNRLAIVNRRVQREVRWYWNAA